MPNQQLFDWCVQSTEFLVYLDMIIVFIFFQAFSTTFPKSGGKGDC